MTGCLFITVVTSILCRDTWSVILVVCLMICSVTSEGNTYCQDGLACQENEYCDSGYHYCMPCSLICKGPMYHEGECKQHCPGTEFRPVHGEKPSSIKTTTEHVTHPTPHASAQRSPEQPVNGISRVHFLYATATVVIMLCLLSLLALACFMIRKNKHTSRQSSLPDVELQFVSADTGHHPEQAEATMPPTNGEKLLDPPPSYSEDDCHSQIT